MKNIIKIACCICFTLFATRSFSQGVTVGGQLGWAIAQGDIFKSSSDEKLASGGLVLDVDALYHLEQLDYKLGLGVHLNSSLIFGMNTDTRLDVGLYTLNLYAAKAQYRFFTTSVSPYAALSTGLSQLSTPQITDGNGNVILDLKKSYGFGLRPEIGIDLGGFIISTGYIVPMKYGSFDKSAGALQISIGYRYDSF